jgi:integrase
MPSPFREIAKLAALTLMRMTEIRTLTRNQIRLDQGVLELPTTKTEPRYVVLSEAARKILKGQLEAAAPPCDCSVMNDQHQHVFPRADGRPYTRERIGKAFRRAARAAGLRDFHFHDLRHHGATMALNKGFTASIVMALGGWKTERMMRRYAAVTDQTLRAAAEAVSGNELAQAAPVYATR